MHVNIFLVVDEFPKSNKILYRMYGAPTLFVLAKVTQLM
ncbi:hypothetical protein HS7_02640 [Sulfolobales archaeon HS-7]|nr:hypothetical protein HS7_02640 [Sulfolobales archaeon HS-7]